MMWQVILRGFVIAEFEDIEQASHCAYCIRGAFVREKKS